MDKRSATPCLSCGGPAAHRCSKCGGRYCGAACQRAHWRAHAAHCKSLRRLARLGIPQVATAELAALLADPPAEAYDGPKGRGLRARRDIVAGECVGYIVGRDTSRYAAFQSRASATENLREYSYLWENVVGDLASSAPVLREDVNASLINDGMDTGVYEALTARGPLAFAESYVTGAGAALNTALDPVLPATSEWAAYRARAMRAVSAGEPLETLYGPAYWINMLASGTLPGTTFPAALAANRYILHGDAEVLEAFVRTRLGRAAQSESERDAIASAINPGDFPIWLRYEDVRVLYVGARYCVAEWAQDVRAALDAMGSTARATAALYLGLSGAMTMCRRLVENTGLTGQPRAARDAAAALVAEELRPATRGVSLGATPEALAQLVVVAPGVAQTVALDWVKKAGVE